MDELKGWFIVLAITSALGTLNPQIGFFWLALFFAFMSLKLFGVI